MRQPLHLVGDGLAGAFLADALRRRGVPFRQYGDGRVNTPPVGFVHLFQGRTFHRDPLEVEVFGCAVNFWRAHPLAHEWEVVRSVTEGDRLHRSAETRTVPPQFRPRPVDALTYRYGPGFTVAAGRLFTDRPDFAARVEPDELEGVVIHATGLSIAPLLPHLRWDTNPGRTVSARSSRRPDLMILKDGCHLGPNPDGEGFTVGGRVNSRGEVKDDEAELAAGILGAPVEIVSEWRGERIANALDRWPLVGWLGPGRFIFAGFGGRALFWLPFCTRVALRALVEESNEAVPLRLRPDRF